MKTIPVGNFDIYQSIESVISMDTGIDDKISIWELIEEKVNIGSMTPRRKDKGKYEICEQSGKKNGPAFIIKDISTNSYISLNSEEFFTWELIDGKTTVKDICQVFFDKYKKISNLPVKLIRSLEEKNMLKERWWDIYKTVSYIQKKGFKEKLGKFFSLFIDSKLSLKNMDGTLSIAYNKFAWFLVRKEAVFIYCLAILCGLWIFFTMGYFENKLSMQNFITHKFSMWIGFLFSVLPVIFHELAHAFTIKKFGRKVNRAGIMLYIGLPMLFVETTDIWLKPKKERITVSLAGPFTDLLVGSICFLIHKFFGNTGILQILPVVGLIAYIRCLYNFNPLLEFDGYYILMDSLELPGLRKRSFDFVIKGGIKKLFERQKLKKEEYIFLFYGSIAIVYTYWMIFFMLYLWQTQIRSILVEIWENQHNSIYSLVLIISILVFVSIRLFITVKIIFKKIKEILKRQYLKIHYKSRKSDRFKE